MCKDFFKKSPDDNILQYLLLYVILFYFKSNDKDLDKDWIFPVCGRPGSYIKIFIDWKFRLSKNLSSFCLTPISHNAMRWYCHT